MATRLYRVSSLLAAALSAYLLAQAGGPFVAAIPLAIGALLSIAMQAAVRRAPAFACQKKSTPTERIAGFAYFAAAFVIPSLAVGMTSLRMGPFVSLVSVFGAAWLMVWGLSMATRLSTPPPPSRLTPVRTSRLC